MSCSELNTIVFPPAQLFTKAAEVVATSAKPKQEIHVFHLLLSPFSCLSHRVLPDIKTLFTLIHSPPVHGINTYPLCSSEIKIMLL